MPSGHPTNADLSKRRERITKAINLITKIRSEECYTSNVTTGDTLVNAIKKLNEIRSDLSRQIV